MRIHPIAAFEMLFFAVFGQTTAENLQQEKQTQDWTIVLFKIVYGIYMLVSVVVLINLLIAMMSDTYQRIQVKTHNYTAVTFIALKLILNIGTIFVNF